MKRLSELTPEDLIASKVWKFWRDAQSIEQVEAYPTEVLSEDDQQDYVAATHFTFANGESCLGFCSPQDDSGLDYMQPVLFKNGVAVELFSEEDRSLPGLVSRLGVAGLSIEQVFPLHLECLVRVDGRTVVISIHASDLVSSR